MASISQVASTTTQSQKESLTIHLGTQNAEADAAAVASTMQAVAAIVEEARMQLEQNQHVLIKARPFAKGSFEIPLDLILVGTASLYEIHPLLSNIMKVLRDYLEVRKLLKGQPLPQPEKDGTFILNGSNITIQNSVINIVSNGRVTDAVARAADDLLKDESIKDVKFYQGNESTPLAVVQSSEFSYLRNAPTTETMQEGRRSRPVLTTLTIRVAVLEGRGKWKFNYDGAKIDAKILDENFMKQVESGKEGFFAGDRLEVRLLIEEAYNQQIADYERKSYSVAEVVKHIKRSPDPTLF